MPRKTKKQKERIARLRAQGAPFFEPVKREFKFELKGQNSLEPILKKSENSMPSSHISFEPSDIKKSILLTLAIFVFQAVLYLAWFK